MIPRPVIIAYASPAMTEGEVVREKMANHVVK